MKPALSQTLPLTPWGSAPVPDRLKPQRWRDRAEQLRLLAETSRDPVIHQSLLELAETWDDLAARTERQRLDA
jgi:hypothetical protein